MVIRRFHASPEHVLEGTVILDEDESRHLRDVLRIKEEETVNVFDGEGREYACAVRTIEKRRSILTINKQVKPTSPESPLDLTIAAVLLKGDKLDLVVQKAVELGVSKFIPMTSARCDARVGDPAKRADRWRRIAMEATKQCGRAKLMRVADVTEYTKLLNQTNETDLTRIHFSEREGESFDSVSGATRILAFIGPEGGWDDAELDSAREKGIRSITFGGRVMKADTAAVAIASILQHRFGDMS